MRCPCPEPSFMPPGSPNRVPRKRDVLFLEPSFHYLSQFPVNRPPPQVPQWDPYGEGHPSTEPSTSHPLKIHLSLRVPGKGASSMFHNRVPVEKDTPSPKPMVYPFMSASVPKQGALLQNGEKYKVTFHRAPHRWKAYIQCFVAWIPMRIVNDAAVSIPVPCGPRLNTFHLGLGRPESR
jgi:hypothetical protein